MVDYGTDLSCVADLDAAAAEVSGRTVLAQAIARRLTTPRGRLIDDANYGFDLRGYLDDDLSTADLVRIKVGAEAECLKDERVVAATVSLQLLPTGVLIVTVVLTDGAGPFTLVLSITAVTTILLSVGQ